MPQSDGTTAIPPTERFSRYLIQLKLDLVFVDRYFMASNELNLLNTLMVSTEDDVQ